MKTDEKFIFASDDLHYLNTFCFTLTLLNAYIYAEYREVLCGYTRIYTQIKLCCT